MGLNVEVDAELYLKKVAEIGSEPFQLRCKYFINNEETFDQIIIPRISETQGHYAMELMEDQGMSLSEVYDVFHGDVG